jgi:hypothetical protein
MSYLCVHVIGFFCLTLGFYSGAFVPDFQAWPCFDFCSEWYGIASHFIVVFLYQSTDQEAILGSKTIEWFLIFLCISVTGWVFPLLWGVANEKKSRNLHAALLDLSTDIPLFIINVLGKQYVRHPYIAAHIVVGVFKFAKAFAFGLLYKNVLADREKEEIANHKATMGWLGFVSVYWMFFAAGSLSNDSQDPLVGLVVMAVAQCAVFATAAYHMKRTTQKEQGVCIALCIEIIVGDLVRQLYIVVRNDSDSQYTIIWFHICALVMVTLVFYMPKLKNSKENKLAAFNFITEWLDLISFIVILTNNVNSLAWQYFGVIALGLHVWVLPLCFLSGSEQDEKVMKKHIAILDVLTDVPILYLNFSSGNYKEVFVAFNISINIALAGRATIFTFYNDKWGKLLQESHKEEDGHYVEMSGR